MNTGIIIQFKNTLSESSLPWVIRALHQESLCWDLLTQDEDLLAKGLEYCGATGENWSPANLFYLSLGKPDLLNTIPDSHKLGQQASATFKLLVNSARESRQIKLTLKEAGYVAYHILQLWEQYKDWPRIIEEMAKLPKEIWHPVFACLYGFLPDPEKYLFSLLQPDQTEYIHKLCVHSYLSNPFSLDTRTEMLSRLLAESQIKHKVYLVQIIRQFDTHLATQLAQHIIQQDDLDKVTTHSDLDIVEQMLMKASLFQIAGDHVNAMPMLDAAWEISVRMQAGMTASLAKQAARENDTETARAALVKAEELAKDIPDTQEMLVATQIQTGRLDPTLLNGHNPSGNFHTENPAALLATARLALLGGNGEQAQETAQYALTQLVENPDYDVNEQSIEDLTSLADLLLELSQYSDAVQAAELALSMEPTHVNALFVHSKAQFLSQNLPEALESATMALALNPEREELRVQLKDVLTELEDWNSALHELEILVSRSETPAIEHLLELAKCAIQIQEPNKATQACQGVLQQDPENGLAQYCMGQAVQMLGDLESAESYYRDAITTAPEHVEGWLALAELLDQKGERAQAQPLLEEGLTAVNKPMALHLALGELAAQEGDGEKADREYQTAFETMDMSVRPSLQLRVILAHCKQLFARDSMTEALDILESARQQFPDTFPLLHLAGRIQLALEDYATACETLDAARDLNLTHAGVLLDLAQAMLAMPENAKEAIVLIETAQQLELDNPLPPALMGKAYQQLGESENALKMYQLARNSDLNSDAMWQLELARGVALSSCGLGQPDVAIAALLELIEEDPEDIASRKILCTAYLQAELKEDASANLSLIARQIESHADALWVAETALKIGNIALMRDCLGRIDLQQAPTPAVLVQSGKLWLRAGNENTARKHFNGLLGHAESRAQELQAAATIWQEVGKVKESIPFLKKAASLDNEDVESLLHDLTHAYYHTGEYQAALEIIEQQLVEHPDNPDYHYTKARLHTQLRQTEEALNSYYDLLEMGETPEEGQDQIYYQIARLEWRQGNLATALAHAEKAYQLAPHTQSHQYLAAELNNACLDTARTTEIIVAHEQTTPTKLNWIFLQAEHALREDQEIIATDLIMPILELAADHPRLLAIQAMLSMRLGQQELAEEQLGQALEVLGSLPVEELRSRVASNMLLGVADTALALKAWAPALYLTRNALQSMPALPRAHLTIAKVLILRADYTHLCDDLHVMRHRPTAEAESAEDYKTVQTHIQACRDYSPLTEEHATLGYWEKRAALVFGEYQVFEFAAEDVDALSALGAAARRAGVFESVHMRLLPLQDHPPIAAQLSLHELAFNPEKSKNYAGIALKKETHNPLWLALIGKAALAMQNWELLEQSFEHALKLWEDEPRWRHFAAIAALERHNTKQAIKHLELANQQEENHLPHLILLGKAYLQDSAPGNAVRLFEKASAQAPHKPEIWQLLAESYAAIQEYEKADKAAMRLSKLTPTKIAPLVLRAKLALQSKQPDKALQLAENAARNHSETHQILSLKAKALAAMDQTPEAIETLNAAVLKADEPLPYLLERAELIGKQEGAEAQLNTLLALIKQFPNQPQVLAALSGALKDNEQYDEAVRAAQHALRKNNGELDLQAQAQLHYRLGLLLQKTGQLDQAIHHLGQAIQFLPGYVESYLAMGQTYHDRREYKPALEFFKQAIELAPDDVRPYCQAARSLKECRNYTTAEAMLRRAVELKPLDLGIHRQLGAVMTMNLVHNPAS